MLLKSSDINLINALVNTDSDTVSDVTKVKLHVSDKHNVIGESTLFTLKV